MTGPAVIFVDLVEEKPLSRTLFDETYGVTDAEADAAYRDYLARFQPWRIIVRSGGNHKILFRSSERYVDERDAVHAARIAFGAGSDVYLRQANSDNIELRRGLR